MKVIGKTSNNLLVVNNIYYYYNAYGIQYICLVLSQNRYIIGYDVKVEGGWI